MEKVSLHTDGKYFQICESKSGLKLRAKDSQEEHFAVMKKWEVKGKNQISFHFPHDDYCYSLKVDEKNLMLEKASCKMSGNLKDHVFSSSEDFRFERENRNGSREYHLRAANPTMLYLSLNGLEFTLSDKKTEGAVITHE